MTRDDIIRMANEAGYSHKLEPIRIRIMQEAYDCADRAEMEAYNSVKVMCGEVLDMVEVLIKAERDACAKICDEHWRWNASASECAEAIRLRG
jgi:hypothetical protein